MKALLMKYKLNMLYVVGASIVAGIFFQQVFDNRWLGFFLVGLPLCAIYIYQTYAEQAAYRVIQDKKRHKNKYR